MLCDTILHISVLCLLLHPPPPAFQAPWKFGFFFFHRTSFHKKLRNQWHVIDPTHSASSDWWTHSAVRPVHDHGSCSPFSLRMRMQPIPEDPVSPARGGSGRGASQPVDQRRWCRRSFPRPSSRHGQSEAHVHAPSTTLTQSRIWGMEFRSGRVINGGSAVMAGGRIGEC
jgi:hypothetical protein